MAEKVESNGCLLLVMGLPGSGKTSFARRLMEDLEDAGDIKPFYIGLDDLIPLEKQKLMANQGCSPWKELRKQFVSSCKAFVNTLLGDKPQAGSYLKLNEEEFLETIIQMNPEAVDSKSSDFCFIVEDNFYYKSMREDFFKLAKEAHLGLVIIMMEKDLSECLQRNQSRDCQLIVDEMVIHRMNEIFEKPKRDEFGLQNHVEVYTVSDGHLNTDAIIKLINKSLGNPLEKKEDVEKEEARERDRLVNANSRVHRFDKVLRHCVTILLNGDREGCDSSKYDGKKLSAVRKRLINKFKDNRLGLDDLFSTKDSTEENLIEICLKMIQREL